MQLIAQERALYCADLPAREAAMRDCWAARDLAKLERLAHGVHGTSGTYGLVALGQAGAALETSVRQLADAGPGAPPTAVAHVDAALAELSAQIRQASSA